MLDGSLRILELDHSLIRQDELLRRYPAEIVDLSDLGPSARLWMNKATRHKLLSRLKGLDGSPVTFTGSGDFHHLSEALLSRISQPLCLIIFDFHPDWDILPPRFACGSWVTEALKKKNIEKCALFGVSSDDISGWNLLHGNLKSLAAGRLEIYPYARAPSFVFLRGVPPNPSISLEKRLWGQRIHWSQLSGGNLAKTFGAFLESLPVKTAYISIDKDCLKKDYALTNWEEGMLSLDELLLMLGMIRDRLDIAGVDVTGEYSAINVRGRIKNIVSRMDHPRQNSASGCDESFISAQNQKTNLRILETFLS